MDKLKQFIELETERKSIQEKLTPLKVRLDGVTSRINDLNDSLNFSAEKDFIAQKIWDAFPNEKKELVLEERKKYTGTMDSANYSYAAINTPFDPFHDSWYIVTFQKDGNKVRFEVSCRKNEGTISGLMTFLDTYWTDWFDIKELDSI